MPERRSSKRITASLKIWCESEDFTLLGTTLNLGREGLFVRSSRPPAIGTRVRLAIDELGLIAEGEVRWLRSTRDPGPAGAGVRLVEIVRGGAAYERYIEQNASRSGEHRVLFGQAGEDDR